MTISAGASLVWLLTACAAADATAGSGPESPASITQWVFGPFQLIGEELRQPLNCLPQPPAFADTGCFGARGPYAIFAAPRRLADLSGPAGLRPGIVSGLFFGPAPDDEDLPIDPNSRFLHRGRRDPWIAALASLVIPGAGQFYNSAAPHAFTLKGYDFWMYGQGGVHALLIGVALFHQIKGMRVEYLGGAGVIELTERDSQVWRTAHVINALVAAVSAWFEADLINRCGWNYVKKMRMHAWYDPLEREACVSAGFSF